MTRGGGKDEHVVYFRQAVYRVDGSGHRVHQAEQAGNLIQPVFFAGVLRPVLALGLLVDPVQTGLEIDQDIVHVKKQSLLHILINFIYSS